MTPRGYNSCLTYFIDIQRHDIPSSRTEGLGDHDNDGKSDLGHAEDQREREDDRDGVCQNQSSDPAQELSGYVGYDSPETHFQVENCDFHVLVEAQTVTLVG